MIRDRRLLLVLLLVGGPLALVVALVVGFGVWLESGPAYTAEREVRDGTGLVRIGVDQVARPADVETVARLLARHDGPISIGGARYSMGGQIATEGTLFLDLRGFDDIVALDPDARTIVVEAGITWRKVIEAIDRYDLSVQVLQSYANFTVGGALSVNAHGRYLHRGAVVRSVRWFTLVRPDGTIVRCARDENPDLFHAVIGGYGAFGVIAHVALDLDPNTALERTVAFLPTNGFVPWFDRTIRPSTPAVMFNADLYPPRYDTLAALIYAATDRPVTVAERIQAPRTSTTAERLLFAWVAHGPWGKQMRQAYDRRRLAEPEVVWRNWEATYDVAGLEPFSRTRETYVLQEYFVPVDRFDAFVPKMRAIFQQWHVNVINVSIRHAEADPDTWLTWSPVEEFAFVIYFGQSTAPEDQAAVAAWTRALIDAALSEGGRYYLPYQPIATPTQLRAAYPRIDAWWALKRQVDPEEHLRSRFLDTYFPPAPTDRDAARIVEARPTWLHPADPFALPRWHVNEDPVWDLYRRAWKVARARGDWPIGDALAAGLDLVLGVGPSSVPVEVWVDPRGADLDVIAELPAGDVLSRTDDVLGLLHRGVELVEIGGERLAVVEVAGDEDPSIWGDVVATWDTPSGRRWALEVPVRRLDEVTAELDRAVVRVYAVPSR